MTKPAQRMKEHLNYLKWRLTDGNGRSRFNTDEAIRTRQKLKQWSTVDPWPPDVFCPSWSFLDQLLRPIQERTGETHREIMDHIRSDPDSMQSMQGFCVEAATVLGLHTFRHAVVFDLEIAKHLLDTPVSTIKEEDIARLPYHSPWISLEGMGLSIQGSILEGMIVTVTLNAVEVHRRCVHFNFIASKWLSQSCLTFGDEGEESLTVPEGSLSFASEQAEMIQKTMPLVLYLCSTEPDIQDEAPKPSKLSKRKRRKRQEARAGKVHRVGFKLGQTLRAAEARHSLGGTVRPHLRKGHWKHYWVGARNSVERHRELRWLAPTVVAGTLQDLPEATQVEVTE